MLLLVGSFSACGSRATLLPAMGESEAASAPRVENVTGLEIPSISISPPFRSPSLVRVLPSPVSREPGGCEVDKIIEGRAANIISSIRATEGIQKKLTTTPLPLRADCASLRV